MESDSEDFEESEKKYFFVFNYSDRSCLGFGADSLLEAKRMFAQMIEIHNSKAGTISRRRRGKCRIIQTIDIDPDSIEPAIYG